jgi:expansin (peptidoglycan-binding protein)
MAACGRCVEIQCKDVRNICYPSNGITALVTDQCDENCNATNINLHVFAFEQLAPIKFGRMVIQYRLVSVLVLCFICCRTLQG